LGWRELVKRIKEIIRKILWVKHLSFSSKMIKYITAKKEAVKIKNTNKDAENIKSKNIKKESKNIKITLLANTGIIIDTGEDKFIVDGLHKSSGTSFTGISENILEELFNPQQQLFTNIKHLIFTHLHVDHFSAEYTEEFIDKHKLNTAFFPSAFKKEYPVILKKLKQKSEKKYFFELDLGEKRKVNINENIFLKVFRSIHAGEKYSEVENYCYLFSFFGRTVFVISDSDYDSEYFKKMLKDEKVDLLLINPLFLHDPKGRKVIKDAVSPTRIAVYHIPAAEDDKYNLRKMVKRDLKRYADELPEAEVLSEELQQMIIEI